MGQFTFQNQSGSPDQPPHRKLIGLILLSALIGVGVFFLVSLIFYPAFIARLASRKAVEIAYLEGFTSLMTLAALSGGFVFWVIDRRQKENAEASQERSLSFQQFQDIHDRLVNPEQEEARRWIFTNIPIKSPDEPLEEWFVRVTEIINARPKGWKQERSPGQIHIKQVLNNLDFIGFVCEHFWDAKASDIDWLSPPVSKVWLRIGPYVKHISELRGEPDYYLSASQIGEFCIKWREDKQMPESKFVEGL
ncbi:MAG: hypothetical protein ACK2T7_00215 [Anaerolineales bacterium]